MAVHIRKMMGNTPRIHERTYHSTKAPIVYVTKIPNAKEEAEREPSRLLMLGDEHSLTYMVFIDLIV